MRTAPVSLAYLDDPAGAAEAARAIAELTHHDPLAGDSCVLWTDLIRQAVLTGEGWLIDLELIPPERRDYWADLAAAVDGEPRDFNPNGDTMRAFQAALAAVMVGLQSEPGAAAREGLTAAVLAGNDTDTVAAIAGGLLGGSRGVGAIPAEWVVDINGWPGYRSHDLVRLGLSIVEGGGAEGVWPRTVRMTHPAARPLALPHPCDSEVLIGTLADLDRVDELGVNAVISLCRVGRDQIAPGRVPADRHAQLWLTDSDDPDDNPNRYAVLTNAALLARSWRREGRRVLIHGVAAERRAPSAALAYAGALGADVDEVADRIRNLHPRVNARGELWRAARGVARDLAGQVLSVGSGRVRVKEGVVEMAEDPEVTAFDVEVDRAWAEFERSLAVRIARLGEDEVLGFEVDVPEQKDGDSPYVQFLVFEEEGLRCEVSSNAYLAGAYRLGELEERVIGDFCGFALDRDDDGEPEGNFYLMTTRDDAAMVADSAVQALRLGFTVLHPAMLLEQNIVDQSHAVMPDPADMEPLEMDAAYPVSNPWDIAMLVHRTLYAVTGSVVERDGDGDWMLAGPAQVPVFVSVRSDYPVVRVWARLVREISDGAAALREMNILNRDADRVRFNLGHDALWVQFEVTCGPFVPRHVQTAVGIVAAAAGAVSEDFALRTGGVV